jgi:hypothetical protein
MKIDESVFESIDAGDLTIEMVLDATAAVQDDIEAALVAQAADAARAAGYDEPAIAIVTEDLAQRLRAGRADRLEVARVQLQCRATAAS